MANRTLKLPTSYAVAVSVNDEYVAAAGRNVVLASLTEGRRVFSVHPFAHPAHLEFSPEVNQLGVKSTVGEICLVQVPDGKITAKYRPPILEEGPHLIYSGCGSFVAHITWSGMLRVHRTSDLAVEHQIEFPGDKPFAISSSADRALWLTGHLRGSTDLPLAARLTLLMLWQWPFTRAMTVLEMPAQYLLDAALSPCGHYIAVLRQRFKPSKFELSILTVDGKQVAASVVEDGGIGCKIKWCRNSSLLGLVTKSAVAVYRTPTLSLHAVFPHKYPSDLAFIGPCQSLAIGTWEYGVITPLPDASQEGRTK